MAAIRICHILSGDLWAGAEVMAFGLLKKLQCLQDICLSVILLNERQLAKELRAFGIDVYVVDENIFSSVKCLREVRKIIAAISPEIIHSHGFKEGVFAVVGTLGRTKCKLISTQHSLPQEQRSKLALKSKLKILGSFHLQKAFFTRIAAVSEDIKNILSSKYSFKKSRLVVIYNGIEKPSGVVASRSTDKFVVGAAARFFPIKDFPLLVEVVKICVDLDKNIVFCIAGDGPEKQAVQHLIDKHNLATNCKLLGHLNDMSNYYHNIDVFLNTSVHEGIPMSILEAMSCGKPVIAPNVGGIGEIFVNGTAGFLVDDRKPNIFAERCIELATNIILYRKMSQAAINRVEKCFLLERMVKDYVSLYKRCCLRNF